MRIAIATAIAFAATALTIAPAHADEPTRVMVVGDSVTHGMDGDTTWRYYASEALGQSVDFVGPHRGTVGVDYFDGTYANPDFDQDHASRWGLSMWETLYAPSDTARSVTDLMSNDPDIVVELLGVNDLLWMQQSPEQTIDHVREFVTRARAINPGVDFVLGAPPQVWYSEIAAFGELLPELADELDTDTSRVVFTQPVLDMDTDTYDTTHPTTAGDQKIAAAMTAGLADLGIVALEPQPEPAPAPAPEPMVEPQPVTPAVIEAIAPPATVAPPAELTRPRGVKAIRVGKTVRVKWQAVEGADTYRVRCGKTVTTSRTAAKMKTSASRCVVRAVNALDTSSPEKVKVKQRR